MMFLNWAVKCFLWTSIHLSSYQVIQDVSSVSYPQSCACPDKAGKMYNLQLWPPKDKHDKDPSFRANGTKYEGYSYSYNPCSSFRLGPNNSRCRTNVAICWWVHNLTTSADTYKKIGLQKGARCDYDEDDKETPVVVYKAEIQNRTSIVRLKCAEGDTVPFKVIDEDNWKFELTHSWHFCPNESLPETPEPPPGVGVIAGSAVGAVAGVFVFIGLIYVAARYWNKNNDAGEREPLLRDAAADVVHNPIGQSNPTNPCRPSPIGSSHARIDVNVFGSVRI